MIQCSLQQMLFNTIFISFTLTSLVWTQLESKGFFQHGNFEDVKKSLQKVYKTRNIGSRFKPHRLFTTDEIADEAESFVEDEIQFLDSDLKPMRIGRLVAMDLDIEKDGEWIQNLEGTGRVWRAIIQSPGAYTISLRFSSFHLPDQAELYIIGPNRTLGAFIGRMNNKITDDFATIPLDGDTLIIELWQSLASNQLHSSSSKIGESSSSLMTDSPTCVNGEDDCTLRLHISGIVHGLCDPFVARGDHRQESGLCNIDWTNALSPVDESSNYENKIKKLASGLKDQARSVGLMITDDGQRVCTGTMLNNGAQDGRQLFLTASHCIPRKSTSNFLLAFGFERSSDKASFATGETGQGSGFQALQVVHGLRLLSRWEKSDFALMEVIETIPDSWGVFYAGWSRAAKPPSNVICIHQPSGDFKKLSYYEGETKLSFWREIPAMYHWGVPSWSCGVTEPGSSGSAIFTEEDGLVVGHLHGGIASCIFDDGYDIFGALAFDWEEAPSIENQLKHYLDPLDLNILSMTGSYYHLSSKNRKTEIINTSGHSDMLIPAGKIATNPARFTYNDEQNLNEMKNLRKMASRVGLKIIERQNQTGMIPDPKTCNFD